MSQPTLRLRPAVRRPLRRREFAIATTVLLASAAGGATMAVLQPARAPQPPSAPLVLPLPVPAVMTAPAPAAAPVEQPPFDLAPVIAEGGLRVVLATDVEPHWIGTDIQVRDQDGIRVVTRPLTAIGTRRFSRFVGTRLRLLESDSFCTAEITGVTVVGRFAPDDFGEADHPVSAKAAWEAADGSYLVAGDLRVVDGDCAGALLAQPSSLPPPKRAAIDDETSPELAHSAARMLRAEEGFADATAGTDATIDVKQVSLAWGEKVLVASALVEGCVDREPVLTALYAVQADGTLHPLGTPARVVSIEAAIDVDGDGHIELLVSGDALDVSILRRRASAYVQEAHTLVPIYGCRC